METRVTTNDCYDQHIIKLKLTEKRNAFIGHNADNLWALCSTDHKHQKHREECHNCQHTNNSKTIAIASCLLLSESPLRSSVSQTLKTSKRKITFSWQIDASDTAIWARLESCNSAFASATKAKWLKDVCMHSQVLRTNRFTPKGTNGQLQKAQNTKKAVERSSGLRTKSICVQSHTVAFVGLH